MLFLSSFPDALDQASIAQLLQILANIEADIDETIEWEYFFEIMAHLSEAAMLQPTASEANQIISFMDRALTQHPPLYQFLLPDLQVHTYSINSTISPTLTISLSNHFTLSFDSSFLQPPPPW